LKLTRRLFLRWSALASAALAITRRRARAQSKPSAPITGAATSSAAPQGQLTGLDAKALLPLAQAILPSELGAARIERANAAFAQWIAGYREGEELLHPYGSERIGATGPSPAVKWATQLAALDDAARGAHGKPFRELPVADRAALVQQALAGVQFAARVPAPIAAPHVALGLLAHFLGSADATNLAYNKVIDPRKCRPLTTSPREPVALQRSAARGGQG